MDNSQWKCLSSTPSSIKEAKEMLLSNRGLDINLVKNDFTVLDLLKDPKELNISKSQVEKAAKLLQSILKANNGVVIHGDYDVDGLTSTAILYESLIRIGFKKENIAPFIPNRFTHGYGFSNESFKDITSNNPSSKFPLIILVDCGITATNNILKAKKAGYKVIVIDHHQKSKTVPKADIIVWNPKITASALTYFFTKYLEIKIKDKSYISSSLDLAALGYICDLGDLSYSVGNILTKQGINAIKTNPRPGLTALAEVSNKDLAKVKSFDLGWTLGPRLNASGRITDPIDSLNLLLGVGDLQQLAKNLNLLNTERQEKTKEMYQEALTGISSKKFCGLETQDYLSIVHSNNFHEGVIGLISSKIVKQLYKPAISIAWEGENGKGSCRSVKGVNIVKLLESVSDTLQSYGGHEMAAGLSIKRKDFESFQSNILKQALNQIDPEFLTPKTYYDFNIKKEFLDLDLLDFIDNLEPFGNGNFSPLFVLSNTQIDEFKLLGNEGTHISFIPKGLYHKAIYFGGGKFLDKLNNVDSYDILFSFEKNEWKGNVYPQLVVKGIKPSEF